MQPGQIYADTRRRLVALVRDLDDERAGRAALTGPGWTVRDIVAYLTGVAAAVAAGTLEGLGGSEWTKRQVSERAGRSMPELLAEWDEHAPAVEAFVAGRRGIVPFLVDIATHEQDIRAALGEPPAVESVGFDYGLQSFVLALDHRLKKKGLPALRLRAGDDEWIVGEGEPAAAVATTPVELFRALSGRRSAAQVGRYQWDGDPAPFLAACDDAGGAPPSM